MTTDYTPRYIAHVQETPNSGVVEMQLTERGVPACISSILGFFKVDRESKLHSIRIMALVGGSESMVYSMPPSGTIFPDNVTMLRARPKKNMIEYRVVWFKKTDWKPIAVEVTAETWQQAADKAIRIDGLTAVEEAQFITVMELSRDSAGRIDGSTHRGEIGVRHQTKAALTTPAAVTTVVAKSVVPLPSERKIHSHPYNIIRTFNGQLD